MKYHSTSDSHIRKTVSITGFLTNVGKSFKLKKIKIDRQNCLKRKRSCIYEPQTFVNSQLLTKSLRDRPTINIYESGLPNQNLRKHEFFAKNREISFVKSGEKKIRHFLWENQNCLSYKCL
jgi:hypothetical protein